jgi:serine/threonine protein kinase
MPAFSDNVVAQRALRRLGSSLCGRYSILRLIGIGGMAAVYAGVHRNGHAVAIKILHERLATDPEIERLFRREAQLANRIGHPGVLPVIDDDVTEDGCVFLVMPLLEGETLRARAERQGRKLPVAEVVALAHSLLETLAAAHAKKIVHRDIKPENVFVTTGGEVKVLDFGIGRFFESSEPGSATRSGRALGTPAFMAPEQALGRMREVDGRTDIWALGATMFSLLTGRFVHDAETPTELAVLAATRRAPRLRELAPEVPEPIRAVIDRALAFKKDERWAGAEAMDQALLAASVAALGVPVSELRPIVVPEPKPNDEVAGLPTLLPPDGARLGHVEGQDPDLNVEAANRTGASPAFRGAPTRTTEFAPPGAGAMAMGFPSRQRTWGPRSLVLGGGLLGVVIMVASFRVYPGRQVVPAITAGASAAQSTPPIGSAFTSGTLNLAGVSGGSFPEPALRDYAVGLRLWLDAAPHEAAVKFDAAAVAAPTFAAAHLWYVIAASSVDTPVREHYASAVLYRDALNEGQHRILDALGPWMGDPPDLRDSETRLAQLAKDSHDPIVPLVLARMYLRQGNLPEGVAALDQLEAGQVELPTLALYIRASLSALDNDVPSARSALRACADRSPPGRECLTELWWLEANEGNCGELEALCRRMLSNDPESLDAYSCFVDALAATGATSVALRAAYAEEETRTPEASVASERAENAARLAVLEGRLADAARSATDWQSTLSSHNSGTFARLVAYEFRIELDMELQRGGEARRVLTDMEGQSRSWPRSASATLEGTSVYLRSLVGTIAASERDSERADLSVAFKNSLFMSPTAVWYALYARTAWSPAEARTTIERMPTRPLFAPQYRDADNDYRVGQVFALAGEREKAKVFLRRASLSCSANTDLARTEAKVALAQLSEDTPEEACPLYSSVAQHWHSTPGSKAVTVAVSRARTLHCPEANPIE